MTKYQISSIVPSFYNLDKNLENIVFRYNSDEHLEELLLDLINQYPIKHNQLIEGAIKKHKGFCQNKFVQIISNLY